MDVLNFLLSQDSIDLDVQDTEGWTPFHAAVCWEQQEAMRLLAEKGASMDVKNLHGETAYGESTFSKSTCQHTMEPPNNGHIQIFILYREVVLSLEV